MNLVIKHYLFYDEFYWRQFCQNLKQTQFLGRYRYTYEYLIRNIDEFLRISKNDVSKNDAKYYFIQLQNYHLIKLDFYEMADFYNRDKYVFCD